MRLVILPLAASLLALVSAQDAGPNAFKIPKDGLSLAAGQPTTLNWDPTTPGTISLYLRSGASSALDQGELIESGIDNTGTYTYTPASDVVRGSDYTIEIVSDTDTSLVNFTPPLVVESGNTVKSITPLPSSASATLAASSSSSSSSSSLSASSSSAASVSSVSSSAASSSSAAVSSSSAASSASIASSASSVSSVRSSATAQSTASRASATSGLSASASRASATAASGTQTATGTSVPTTAPGAGAKAYGASSAAAMVLLCMMAVW